MPFAFKVFAFFRSFVILKKLPFFFLLLAPIIAAPAWAGAQTSTTPTQNRLDIAGSRVNAAQLHNFAAAYRAVTKVRKQLMIKTHAMTDEEKISALTEQAQEKMKQAIRKRLTLGEYVRIGRAVNANPALHARFMRIRAAATRAAPAAESATES